VTFSRTPCTPIPCATAALASHLHFGLHKSLPFTFWKENIERIAEQFHTCHNTRTCISNSTRVTIHAPVFPKSEHEIILQTFKTFLKIFAGCHGRTAWHSLDISLDPKAVHVGFEVDKVAPGQVFLQVLQFSPAGIIPPMPHTHSLLTTDAV
jgi:hypothetical protein